MKSYFKCLLFLLATLTATSALAAFGDSYSMGGMRKATTLGSDLDSLILYDDSLITSPETMPFFPDWFQIETMAEIPDAQEIFTIESVVQLCRLQLIALTDESVTELNLKIPYTHHMNYLLTYLLHSLRTFKNLRKLTINFTDNDIRNVSIDIFCYMVNKLPLHSFFITTDPQV